MYKVPSNSSAPSSNAQDNFDKGKEFEHYILKLFNERNFNLHEWRKSEKFNGASLPYDPSHPDLEMIFAGAKKHRFAVECKWRAHFKNGKIKWATGGQISSYRDFYFKTGFPVFIAIGVGGTASNPAKLFVTPLNNIWDDTEVHESRLIAFERRPARRFFYDTVQLRLF